MLGLTGWPLDKVSIKVSNIWSGDCWKNGFGWRCTGLLVTGLEADATAAVFFGFNCPIRFGFTPTAAD